MEKDEELLKEMEAIDSKQKELNQKEVELANREKAIKDLEKIRDDLEASYKAKEKKLQEHEAEYLKGKTLEVQSKETEIKKLDKELALKRQEKTEILLEIDRLKSETVTQVEEYKSTQIAKFNAELSEKIKKEIASINDLTKNLLSSQSTEISKNLQNISEQYSGLLSKYDELAKEKQKLVDAEREKLEKVLDEYEKKLEETGDVKNREIVVSHREKIIERREKQFETVVNEKIKELYSDLQNDVKRYKERIEQLNNEYHDALAERDDLRIENENLKSSGIESMQKQLDEYRQRNAELESKYKAYTDYEFKMIENKAKHYDSLLDQNNKLLEENQSLHDQILKYEGDMTQNNKLKFENETLRLQISTNDLYLTKLKTELEDLRSRVDDAASGTVASEAIEMPYEKFTKYPLDKNTEISEIKWLNNIIDKCEESGFKFSKRLVYSFHTCLKTSAMSPLTVLAGISGTGKSKLPQLYSRFGGIYFISLPVQPDWDSPQSLFGYFNSIEKRFNATTLLRAMVSFQKEKGDSDNIYDLSDRVLLVLLDEMNLAHVELYFADLLSKLEEQRGEKDVQTFEVDLGAGRKKYSIRLSRNILWSGTMNEDETTKSLSDKVVDRGNVISFPRPTKFERYIDKSLAEMSPMISKEVWNAWNSSDYKLKLDDKTNGLMEKYCLAVMKINLALKYANRALGHRVWQSIENYIVSHPIVIEHKNEDSNLAKAMKYAFEEAIVHKIMPKLRGIELSDEIIEQCLNPIKDILSEQDIADGLVADFDDAMNNSATGTFVWDSAKYLDKDYEF